MGHSDGCGARVFEAPVQSDTDGRRKSSGGIVEAVLGSFGCFLPVDMGYEVHQLSASPSGLTRGSMMRKQCGNAV